MFNFSRNLERHLIRAIEKQIVAPYASTADEKTPKKDEFRVLNIRNVRLQTQRPRAARSEGLPPRADQMAVDQDWGSVWPGPRSFHPATVPLPLHQGYTPKKIPPPSKYANAELMKIPNFLHLTPPVIKRQCEALKKFCTPWPKALDSDEKCQKLFPIEVTSSDYCHSSPTIRDPMARIVTLRFKLSSLELDQRAKDKFLRLIGDRYDEETDTVTIVTDRCPLKKQNYDYAMYLMTAVYHESWNVEPWEAFKSEEDMESYDWSKSVSKKNIEARFSKNAEEIPNCKDYENAVSKLLNEGENEEALGKYGDAVKKLLNVPSDHACDF